MDDANKSKQQLIKELSSLRRQVVTLQDKLNLHASKDQPVFALGHKLLTLLYAGATIASSLDLKYVLETFSREIVSLLNVQDCIISKWDPVTDQVQVIATYKKESWWPARGMGVRYPSVEVPLTQWVLTKRQAECVTINQVDIDPADLNFLKKYNLKTLMVLPMEFRSQMIGLVEVVDTEVEQTFAAEDIAFTQFLANQAAAAMENAHLYAQAQQEILERQQKEKELRQMANRNQAILDAIPDSLFFLSRQGQLLDYRIVNGDNLLLEIFDQGMPPTQQNLNYPPQLLSHMMEQFVTAIGKALDQRTTQVLEYQSPSLFDIQYYETRLVASGKDEALAIVRNVTQRKQTERQLIHTERLAALGQLAAALAHEINNPLQAIQSNLDLILQYPLTASENEQYLQVIHRQVERMTNITHKVLNFTRPQTSPRELVLITDLIEDVLTLTGKKLEQCRINVIVEAPDDLPFVLATPQQLTQVFLNLVINTLEAVTGQNGQLNISIYQEIDEIAVSFTSNSPIIPPEILSRIFDPFFTTKPDGNGLGLWVSHSLIQRHNGSLTVENLTNKRGVVFTVRLPILDPLE